MFKTANLNGVHETSQAELDNVEVQVQNDQIDQSRESGAQYFSDEGVAME